MTQDQFIEFVYAMHEAYLNRFDILEEMNKHFKPCKATCMLYKAALEFTLHAGDVYRNIDMPFTDELVEHLKEVVYFWVPEHLAEKGLSWSDISINTIANIK